MAHFALLNKIVSLYKKDDTPRTTEELADAFGASTYKINNVLIVNSKFDKINKTWKLTL